MRRLLIVVLVLILYLAITYSPKVEGFEDTLVQFIQKQSGTALTQQLPLNQRFLINLQPLTGYLAGYIGPVDGGVFSPQTYLPLALKAGIRSFFLPISWYIDDNKTPAKGWPISKHPAVVCRNAQGTIISSNGMSIKDFVTSLVQVMKTYYPTDIVNIYIDGSSEHLPDPSSQERDYVVFMSKIASELSQVHPYMLTTYEGRGSMVGGLAQSFILQQIPLAELSGKIFIHTNFQINIATKDIYQNITPSLYEYTNFVYAPYTASEPTTQSKSTNINGRLIGVDDISGSKINWALNSLTIYHIALLSDPLTPPDTKKIQVALSHGIQCIPLPFFFNDNAIMESVYQVWNGSSYLVKGIV